MRLVQRLYEGGSNYDIVVACGLFRTAISAWIATRLHGGRLLIEVPVLPRQIVLHRDPNQSWHRTAKAWWLERCATVLLRQADHCKWIFPGQATAISPRLASRPCSTFPDFVAVRHIARSTEEGAIVLLGTPLYLKGADLAIEAFQHVLTEFPDERLRLIGSSHGFPHLAPRIRRGDPIELVDYLPHTQAIAELQRAKIVLIPSRTDAMPRVAVEAMAAGKPIIASRVDGMAHYLRDGRNCLLVPPVDVRALAEQLVRLLGDTDLRRRLGDQARADAQAHFTESCYADAYRRMLDACCADRDGEVWDYH